MTSNDFLFDKKTEKLVNLNSVNEKEMLNEQNPSIIDTNVSTTDIPLKYTPDIPLPLCYQIPSKTRNIIFSLMALISIVSSFDGGIIPAATNEVKQSLNIDNVKLGFFGSADYCGRLFGAIITFSLINKMNRKYLFLFALIVKTLALCSTYFSKYFEIIIILRGFSGFSQVFFTIYLPVWCDQYGTNERKTMMITIIQLGVPLGIVLGFIMCTLLHQRWLLSVAIEGLFILAIAIAFFFISNKYFSHVSSNQKNKENDKERSSKVGEIRIKERSLLVNIISIIKEPIFSFTCLTNSVSFFTMGIIQFWGANYMKESFNVEDDKMIMLVFSILSITGPTLGVIIGGVLGSYIGGYESKNCALMCSVFCLLSAFAALPIGLVNFIPFCICAWLYLFFAGAMNPLETGIIISSLPSELRGDASSIMNFILNLLGNLPPAFIYGIISQNSGSKPAMIACTNYSFLGVVFIIVATVFRFRKDSEERNSVLNRDGSMKSTSTSSSAEDLVMIEERISNRISRSIAQIFTGYPKNSINDI